MDYGKLEGVALAGVTRFRERISLTQMFASHPDLPKCYSFSFSLRKGSFKRVDLLFKKGKKKTALTLSPGECQEGTDIYEGICLFRVCFF